MAKHENGLALALRYVERDARRKPPRWKAPDGVQIRRIRESVGLSQEKFAERYGLSVVSLRKWEQDRASPEQAAVMVLRMIEIDPGTVENIIGKARESQLLESS